MNSRTSKAAVFNSPDVAGRISTTVAGQAHTKQEVGALALATRQYRLAGLAVDSYYLEFVRELLQDSSLHTVGLANLPLAGCALSFVIELARWCFQHGADEVDFGIPIRRLRSGCRDEIRRLLGEMLVVADGRVLKAVIPSGEMTEAEVLDLCGLLVECGVPCVRTSPGFGHITSPGMVSLVKREFGDSLCVMVESEIRELPQVLEWLRLGADGVTVNGLQAITRILSAATSEGPEEWL